MKNDPSRVPGNILGWLGVIPFIVGTFCSYEPIFGSFLPPQALIFYSAVVVSFLGAVNWGAAIQASQNSHPPYQLVYSVIPSLLAWFILTFLGHVAALNALGGVFILTIFIDHRFSKKGLLPVWYIGLRFKLSLVVCICLFSAARIYQVYTL